MGKIYEAINVQQLPTNNVRIMIKKEHPFAFTVAMNRKTFILLFL